MKQSPLIIIGVLVLVVLGGGFLMMKSKSSMQPSEQGAMEKTINEPSGAMMQAETTVSSSDPKIKEIPVIASNYSFSTTEIRVKKGDTVTIKFYNNEGTHDFVIDEFKVRTEQLNGGSKTTVTFTPDKSGEFEYYCSTENHRNMGMVGKLIVEE